MASFPEFLFRCADSIESIRYRCTILSKLSCLNTSCFKKVLNHRMYRKTLPIVTENRSLITFKKHLLLILIYVFPIQNAYSQCQEQVARESGNYYSNLPFNAYIRTKSWTELALHTQSEENKKYAREGRNIYIVLSGPTDKSRTPICYQLYADGELQPGPNDDLNCGFRFTPTPNNFDLAGHYLLCPRGYERDNSGSCNLIDSETNVCPAIEKESAPPEHCGVGNPIDHATGTKYTTENDIPDNGPFSLTFDRFYTHTISGAKSSANLGSGWRHSYSRELSINERSGGLLPNSVVAYKDNGEGTVYQLSNGSYGSTSDEINTLEFNATNGEWEYTDKENRLVEYYDHEGRLLRVTFISGLTKKITYFNKDGGKYPESAPTCQSELPATQGLAARIWCITNEVSAQLNFIYDDGGRISAVKDPAGGVYEYQYSFQSIGNQYNLSKVVYPDGKEKTYLYNEPDHVSATSTTIPFVELVNATALTGILDENGERYATYNYDGNGRAISTEHGQGLEKYTVAYNLTAGGMVIDSRVTDPIGTEYSYNFTSTLGTVKSTGVDKPAGAGCPASASNISYDVNGNVASRIDFNGNQTSYVYDLSRNLEITRIEGLDTSGAVQPETRTITTSWHPTLRLPQVVSEYSGDTTDTLPMRRRTITYDDKGNINSIRVEAPIHGTDRTITTSYSYSSEVDGLMLSKTVDGPRTDVSDVTVYEYYAHDASCDESIGTPIIGDVTSGQEQNIGCRGQLKSQTNALGHITTFDRYNHHGQLEQKTDANGLVTIYTYDLRQRLTSSAVDTELTNYQYNAVGQLDILTLPDGSQLAYDYDMAHRLTDISDSQGNTIHYTLDNLGNRIKEETHDVTGTLTKTLSRSYDALSRLEYLEGIE